MATAKQIAARKKFAERARSGELARMRKKNPVKTAQSGIRKKRVTKRDTQKADAAFEKKHGFSPKFIEQFGRLVQLYEKSGVSKEEAIKAAQNQVKAMTENLRKVKTNPTATRAPARSRTKLMSNGERKKNPATKDFFYVNVIDDGGFQFGMDDRTPALFKFSNREMKRGVYRSFALPFNVTSNPEFQNFVKSLPGNQIVISLRDLRKNLSVYA